MHDWAKMNGPIWEDSFSGRARLGGIVVRPQSTTVPISHYTNWIVPRRWRKYFPSNQDGMQIEGQELKATFIHCRRYKWIKDFKTPRTIKEKSALPMVRVDREGSRVHLLTLQPYAYGRPLFCSLHCFLAASSQFLKLFWHLHLSAMTTYAAALVVKKWAHLF